MSNNEPWPWIKHRGNSIPVRRTTIVEIRYGRRLEKTNQGPAGLFDWEYAAQKSYCVHEYRVVSDDE